MHISQCQINFILHFLFYSIIVNAVVFTAVHSQSQHPTDTIKKCLATEPKSATFINKVNITKYLILFEEQLKMNSHSMMVMYDTGAFDFFSITNVYTKRFSKPSVWHKAEYICKSHIITQTESFPTA